MESLAGAEARPYLQAVVALRTVTRCLRFFLLETLALPLAILPLRVLIWTWRRQGPLASDVAQVAAMPRVVCAVWHGTILQTLAFASVWNVYGRRWVALTTPSLDGRLAGAVFGRMGVRHAYSAGEFARRIKGGDVGVILVDGPLGPAGVVNPDLVRVIAALRARVVAVGLAASRAVCFGSWDGAALPLPFSRIHLRYRLLPPDACEAAAIQAAMDTALADAADAVAQPPSRAWSARR